MADRWLMFDCYGTIADWNTGMGRALEVLAGAADTKRLLAGYHQAEVELEADPDWETYREVLTAGLASAAPREGITLPPGGDAVPSQGPTPPDFARPSATSSHGIVLHGMQKVEAVMSRDICDI